MPDSKRIRCLLVDDDQAAFHLTRAIMDQIPWVEFHLDWLPTAAEGLMAMRRREHDVYLLDYQLGEESGIDLARKAREAGVDAPMILLTGKGAYDVDVEAMESGLLDYLDKGRVDPDLMERSIRYAMNRHRAEAALRESEARNRAMFEHLPIGFYRATTDGELLDANPALETILGRPDRDDLEFGYARSFFVGPSRRQAFLDRLDQFGVVRGFESDLKRADGRTIRVRCVARLHRADDGSTLYVEGAVEDVTDRLEARELRGGADRFRWVEEASGLATLALELDGTVMDANAGFLETYGYQAAALRGQGLGALSGEADRDALERDLAEIAKGKRDSQTTRRPLLASDGTMRWARTRIGLVRSSTGDPDHLLVLLDEVTDG